MSDDTSFVQGHDGSDILGNAEGKMTWQQRLFKPKPVDLVLAEASGGPLLKTLNLMDLILIGIGAQIGAGIFVITGVSAVRCHCPAFRISLKTN
jgi:hypothetical protein